VKQIECPSCALQAPADAETCPYCGYEFPEQRRSIHWMAWVFIGIMVLFYVINRVV